jgi:hypothetical protein
MAFQAACPQVPDHPRVAKNCSGVELHDGLKDGGQITPDDQTLDAGPGHGRLRGERSGMALG